MKGGLLQNSFAYNGNQSSSDVILPYTIYVSPFLIYEGKNGSGEWQYSKHFYAGGERIASKIGSKYTDPTSNTSGNREWNNETSYPYGQKAILVQLQGLIGTMDLGDPSLIPTYRTYVNPYDTINECLEGFSQDEFEEERCICMWFPDQADSTLNCNTERTFWYHADYIGHTEFITDEAGRPYQYFAYMPFGEQYVEQHAANGFYSSAFRFNGKEYDEYTGQYYYGARYHDPLIGIWLSPDPMFFARPNLTPYNFVQNNPIMLWDPTGMLDSGEGDLPTQPEKCYEFEPSKGDSNFWRKLSNTFQRIGEWFSEQMKSEKAIVAYQTVHNDQRNAQISVNIEDDMPRTASVQFQGSIGGNTQWSMNYRNGNSRGDNIAVRNAYGEELATNGYVLGNGSLQANQRMRGRSFTVRITPQPQQNSNSTSWLQINLDDDEALYVLEETRYFFGLIPITRVRRVINKDEIKAIRENNPESEINDDSLRIRWKKRKKNRPVIKLY